MDVRTIPNTYKLHPAERTHRHIFYLSWPLGFCISAAVWLALNAVWPPPAVGEVDDEDAQGFDAALDEQASVDEENAVPLGKEDVVLEDK